jgi:glycosyltransferase involved in cell wall biosynthesis
MRLLIISNMAHYIKNDQVVGWGPAVEELNHLATLFTEVKHIACLHPGPAPFSSLPYQAKNLNMIFVPPSGGRFFMDKLRILFLVPLYIRTMLRELPEADVVHVRGPANIALFATLLLSFLRKPGFRWIKYAGNWHPDGEDPWSYRLQRHWLRKGVPKALVTVNGEWPDQPSHVRSFLNPCLTAEECEQGARLAGQKGMHDKVSLIFAGRVENAKGIEIALQVIARLFNEDYPVHLDVVGDGPARKEFQQMALDLNIGDVVKFHGWVPRNNMGLLYANAHLILLPTVSEGWPKVLSEAMAYGAVPIASDVGSIGQYLHRFQLGCAIRPIEIERFVTAVKSYINDREKWQEESERAIVAAKHFTYPAYLGAVRAMLSLPS